MNHYLIIGGSSGVGLALTEKLSHEGNAVTVLSRTEKSLVGMENVTHYPCDISAEPPPFPTISAPIDGIVYLPGTINLKPFAQLKIEDYQRDFDINFLGAVKVLRHYLPNIQQKQGGSIVLMSSAAARKGFPMHCSISAVKSAVEGLAVALAAELAPNTRVNGIAPALTDTPMAAPLLDSPAKKEGAAKRNPLKRLGTAEDISEAIAFLLSSSSRWITGQIIGVDGGVAHL